MLRGIEITINPNIKYSDSILDSKKEESEWKRSIHYFSDNKSLFKAIEKGCKKINNSDFLKPLSSVSAQFRDAASKLTQLSRVASVYTTGDNLASFLRKGKLGCNVESAKEALNVVELGNQLVYWFSFVEGLSVTVRLMDTLTSVSLVTALLRPTIDLLVHLRQEGLEALQGVKFYKTSYKLGLALISIYLFMASATLSTCLGTVISGIDYAFAAPEYFDAADKLGLLEF